MRLTCWSLRRSTELAARLPLAIETGTALESLTEESDGTFRCSVRRNGTSSVIRAPQVLLTMPFTMVRNVDLRMELPQAKRDAMARLGYGTNAKLMAGFDRRLWREAH